MSNGAPTTATSGRRSASASALATQSRELNVGSPELSLSGLCAPSCGVLDLLVGLRSPPVTSCVGSCTKSQDQLPPFDAAHPRYRRGPSAAGWISPIGRQPDPVPRVPVR